MVTMIPNPPSPISDQKALELWNSAHGNSESFICAMRDLGADKIDCIKALRHVKGIPTNDAKEIVHFSKAWDDRRVSDEKFHEDLIQALYEDGFRDVEQPATIR